MLTYYQIFKHATLFFSRGNTPSLSKVIPAMDHIDAVLATTLDDITVPPSIRTAVAIGKRTLNKYYNKTDHTEVYRIAMGASMIVWVCMLTNSMV